MSKRILNFLVLCILLNQVLSQLVHIYKVVMRGSLVGFPNKIAILGNDPEHFIIHQYLIVEMQQLKVGRQTIINS